MLGTSNGTNSDSGSKQLLAGDARVSAPDMVLSASSDSGQRWRPVLSAGLAAVGCVFFCLTLSKMNAGLQALPWYVTLGALAVLALGSVRRSGGFFNCTDAVHVTGFRNREPLNILESLAASYLVAALILYSFACLSLWLPKKPVLTKHVVDIEFTSLTDRVDNQEVLPGEIQPEEVRKRTGDLVTAQGSLQPNATPQAAAERQEPEKKILEKHKTYSKPETAPKPLAPPAVSSTPVIPPVATPLGFQPPAKSQPLSMPSSWSTQVVKNLPPQPRTAVKDGPMFEEVQPPELVEMVDNEGSVDATKITQMGGRSSGGTGAKSDLNTYLKELHKKIKTAWAPPRGQSRRAEILFRIAKPGRLTSLRLVKSSGDGETDEAAMHAVAEAVKGQPDLPPAYAMPYLDVLYTFNYTADELQEVGKPSNGDR